MRSSVGDEAGSRSTLCELLTTWEPGGLPSMGLHRVGHN